MRVGWKPVWGGGNEELSGGGVRKTSQEGGQMERETSKWKRWGCRGKGGWVGKGAQRSPEIVMWSPEGSRVKHDPHQGRGSIPAKSPSDPSWRPGPGQPQPLPPVLAPETRYGSSGCWRYIQVFYLKGAWGCYDYLLCLLICVGACS